MRTRSPHDSLQAAYNEILPKLLSAAKQALDDYEYIYPNNNPANLLGKDFDDMSRSIWQSVEVEVLKPWRGKFFE